MTSNSNYEDQEPLFELRGVEKHFSQTDNLIKTVTNELFGREPPKVRAVDGINLELYPNQVQGVIGESGCGKSTLLMTLMGLHDPTGGELIFDGKPVSEFDKSDWKEFRRRVQIIFQDPFNSMDPKFTVRETLMEPLQVHDMDRKEERVYEALEHAELNPPEKYLDRLPKQLSGGEKQRVSIARALVLEPDVILADEPVSMLDVSTQAAVLRLLSDLTDNLGVSMFYISHDLSTVSYVCEKVNVMYLGRIVEEAPTQALIDDPKHPYSQALIEAIPIPDPHFARDRTSMQGSPSDPINLPSGCRFKDRCPERMPICDERPLDWELEGEDRQVACHLYYDHEDVAGSSGAMNEEAVVSDDD
jgi:peptide/nickel transport system ATP-binding protein